MKLSNDPKPTLSPGETRLVLLALGNFRAQVQRPGDVDKLAARLARNVVGGTGSYGEGQTKAAKAALLHSCFEAVANKL